MSKTEETPQVVTEKNIDFAKASKFVSENQKSLLFIGGAIVAMIFVFFAYQKFYIGPREETAANQIYYAQDLWAKKEWDKAINGDAGYPGLQKIINDYSNTKAANLAYFYLGTAYLNKGDYRKAIENLTNYRGEDNIVAAEALGGTGDAYVELKDYDEAQSYYEKAIEKSNNKFITPIYLKKLGLLFEAKNDFKSASEQYNKIKKDYPEAQQSENIDEYIARAEAKL